MLCSPPRGTLTDDGRGSDCGRISGAVERAPIVGRAPLSGIPRDIPGTADGRGTEPLPIAPRSVAPVAGRPMLFVPMLVRPMLLGPMPRLVLPELRIVAMLPRFTDGGVMRLIIGREKVRAGAAVPRPAPPSMVVRVGCTPGVLTDVSDVRLSWFGETRTPLCATESEFTSVLREAAENPPGARRFA